MRQNVGIITIYGENNYGNRLQNYAVHKVLSDMGIQCETITQKPIVSYKDKMKVLIKGWACMLFPKLMRNKRTSVFREFKFKNFTERYIPTRYYSNSMHQLTNKYDYFVVGSDQVWNPTFGNYEKIIDYMFLKFAKPEQKVCFAPSFGINKIPAVWEEVFKENLNTFNYISVREDSGAEIVKQLTGKDAEVLIDPTMMLDKEEWLEISKPSKSDTSKPYMLQYLLGSQNETYKKQLDTISRQNDLKVLSIMDSKHKELFSAAPDEFIYLISKSSLVCTDSFHAVVFSILFDKPFIVFKRDDENVDMSSRMETLFRKFNLKSRYYNDIDTEDILSSDYEQCHSILAAERKKVIDFLNNSIRVEG